jgi:membrane protease YdiL (CAAX protease family)
MAIAVAAGLIVAVIIATVIIHPPGMKAGDPAADRLALTGILLTLQNAALLLGVVAATRGRSLSQFLGLRRLALWQWALALAAGLIIGPVLSFGIGLLQALLGQPPHTPGASLLAPAGFSWTALAMMLFLGGVIAPFAEEALFRGVIFGWLRQRVRLWLAALLSAIPFGVAHIQPEHILYATGVGFLLALLYQRFRSLWASIAAHMAINLLAISYLYYTLAQGIPLSKI